MRLFVAIDIPEEIKEYLKKLQAFIPQENMRLTTDFHLTLKFIGSADDNMKKAIEEALRGIPFRPFEASLTEAGIFSFHGMPRAVWVGIKVPDWLFDSQKLMEERLAKLGIEEEHRFSPHITLARVKFANNPKSFETAINRIKVEPRAFPVEHFYLFESHLSP